MSYYTWPINILLVYAYKRSAGDGLQRASILRRLLKISNPIRAEGVLFPPEYKFDMPFLSPSNFNIPHSAILYNI